MQKINVQTNDVPKTAVTMLILTREDFTMEIKRGLIDEPSLDMLSRHDFTFNSMDEIKSAAYIMYVSPTGQIKYLKAKKPIQQ